jgi:hypothetical protein
MGTIGTVSPWKTSTPTWRELIDSVTPLRDRGLRAFAILADAITR